MAKTCHPHRLSQNSSVRHKRYRRPFTDSSKTTKKPPPSSMVVRHPSSCTRHCDRFTADSGNTNGARKSCPVLIERLTHSLVRYWRRMVDSAWGRVDAEPRDNIPIRLTPYSGTYLFCVLMKTRSIDARDRKCLGSPRTHSAQEIDENVSSTGGKNDVRLMVGLPTKTTSSGAR